MREHYDQEHSEAARLLESGSVALQTISENVKDSAEKQMLLKDIRDAFLTYANVTECRASGSKLLTFKPSTQELVPFQTTDQRSDLESALSEHQGLNSPAN